MPDNMKAAAKNMNGALVIYIYSLTECQDNFEIHLFLSVKVE